MRRSGATRIYRNPFERLPKATVCQERRSPPLRLSPACGRGDASREGGRADAASAQQSLCTHEGLKFHFRAKTPLSNCPQILRELAEERRKDGVHPVLEEAELSDVTRPRMMQVSCLVPPRKLPYSRQRLGRQLRDDAELNAAMF